MKHAAHLETHLSPSTRLFKLLSAERKDLIAFCLYVGISGLLSLAVPLAAQALVNTIAAGVFLQPLIVLTLAVFVCLLLAGVIRLLKLSLLERLQKRVFAQIAIKVAAHLPQVKHSALLTSYAPQLVNRFFDVITIQKTFAKLLIDGPTAILQIIIGFILMALYSPLLLAFAAFIVIFLIFGIWILGIGGLRTSITESYQKYHVAEWLEEIGRCQVSFKTFGSPSFPVERTDNLVVNYINARRAHFQVIYRQAVAHHLFRALASAGILAVGGWLVINRQLTLGQLVATNLIVVSVLVAVEKLIASLESVYDLLTAIDKVGYLTDLPIERSGGRTFTNGEESGASVVCRGVRYSYRDGVEALSGLNLAVQPGEKISLVGKSGAGKSTLAALLSGLLEPTHGAVMIDKMDVREINLQALRENVALVSSTNEAFEGTIEDNVLVGRNLSHNDLAWALGLAQLTEDLSTFSNGIKTELLSEGRNLSRGQIQRLLIARAIIGRPRLLILDEAFTGIDERDKLTILNNLFSNEQNWTIIDISHDPEVVMRSSIIYVMENGQIVETTTPQEITRSEHQVLCRLFPSLAASAHRASFSSVTV